MGTARSLAYLSDQVKVDAKQGRVRMVKMAAETTVAPENTDQAEGEAKA